MGVPSWRSSRGLSIGTTLLIGLVAFVIATTLAALAVMNLQLSSGYRASAQAEMLAHAAVTQFIYDLQPTGTDNPVLGDSATTMVSYDVSLPSPDRPSNLPGTVRATVTDDNSASEAFSALGTPPYSVALDMKAEVEGRNFRYEAILQRTWPYVITAPAPLQFMAGRSSSVVNGPVCALQPPLFQDFGSIPVPISDYSFEQMSGNETGWTNQRAAVTLGQIYRAPSGVTLQGRVDFAALPREDGSPQTLPSVVSVLASNVWAPPQAQRSLQLGAAQAQALRGIFDVPPVPPGARMITDDPQFKFERATELHTFDYNGKTAESERFWLLVNDLELHDGYNVVNGSTGNCLSKVAQLDPRTYKNPYTEDGSAKDYYAPSGIHLNDCVLRVEGNLDMSSDPGAPNVMFVPGLTGNRPAQLTGNNATVIVNGDLVLLNAELNARDQGMIIYCQRLVMNAAGTFNGLILARDGAVILPGAGGEHSGTPLHIRGGLIVGGGMLLMSRYKDIGVAPVPSVALGLPMSGTTLTYDARYLKRLHALGSFSLQTLRRLP